MPKQLKLGVSASWQCDSSGWGQSSTTVSQGSWADSWNNGTDIWGETSSEVPPQTWNGTDDGWREPPPDFSAPGAFPSLKSAKPPRRSKTTEPPPQKRHRGKPADFSDLLGNVERESVPKKETPSSNFVAKENEFMKSLQTKSVLPHEAPMVDNSQNIQSKLNKLAKPTESLQELLNIQTAASPSPITPVANPTNHQKSLVKEETTVKSTTEFSKKGVLLSESVPPPRKHIYTQLQEQLRRLSSLGKPLVYCIQNGDVTVRLAEVSS